jgi:hypothetical protein
MQPERRVPHSERRRSCAVPGVCPKVSVRTAVGADACREAIATGARHPPAQQTARRLIRGRVWRKPVHCGPLAMLAASLSTLASPYLPGSRPCLHRWQPLAGPSSYVAARRRRSLAIASLSTTPAYRYRAI